MSGQSEKKPTYSGAKYLQIGGFAILIVLAAITLQKYPGSPPVYMLFTLFSSLLLHQGFRSDSNFFDAFIGIFLWLGFWLKLTAKLCLSNGKFREAIGSFDGSGLAYDRALLISTCGFAGLLAAKLIRRRLRLDYPRGERLTLAGLLQFYQAYRGGVILCFLAIVFATAFINFSFGIYQRGGITETILPFGMNGVFKWLLLFGLTSMAAIILRCESASGGQHYPLALIAGLLEGFASNVSMLSRGMILNGSALALGIWRNLEKGDLRLHLRSFLASAILFAALFAASVFVVNALRAYGPRELSSAVAADIASGIDMAKPLFVDRWVGLEGVLAVSSSNKTGWQLWIDACQEKYSENTISFYDDQLITSPYKDNDFTKSHFISLPGFLAFFFYPGSYWFLFLAMLLLGLVAAAIEKLSYRMGGRNLILCSLIGEVIAYRFANFGYVPAQSYLLFGSILLNLLLIQFAERLCRHYYKTAVT
jgi:hypothetical protein